MPDTILEVKADFEGAAFTATIKLSADPAKIKKRKRAYCDLHHAVAVELRNLATTLDQHANRVELEYENP